LGGLAKISKYLRLNGGDAYVFALGPAGNSIIGKPEIGERRRRRRSLLKNKAKDW
jgi:hypothetical protein